MKKFILTGLAASLAVAIACGGDKATSPVSPSSTTPGSDAAAGPDGITLKATAPTPVQPANGSTLEEFQPVLTIQRATGKFEDNAVFAYRFQLLSGSAVLRDVRLQSLTWTLDDLDPKTTYGWRARAESGSFFGPWSPTWTFTTPDRPEGYNRPGELYDPLNDGKTIGEVIGSVTFIPGVGARLNGHGSYIRYRLPQTITGGEISVLVTNLNYNTEGGKTKIMAMAQGLDDITTNDRRFTVEKRGDPPGIIAWRVLTSLDQIDTIGRERRPHNFNPNRLYLWQATFGSGRFDLTIKEDGRQVYRFGKNYAGIYDPDPHYAFVGGPGGRAGLSSGTVPEIIVRHFWVSRKPRPSFANQ